MCGGESCENSSVKLSCSNSGGRDAFHVSLSCADELLRQLAHWELCVPAVVSHVAVVSTQFGVFQTVAAHLGVLIVD